MRLTKHFGRPEFPRVFSCTDICTVATCTRAKASAVNMSRVMSHMTSSLVLCPTPGKIDASRPSTNRSRTHSFWYPDEKSPPRSHSSNLSGSSTSSAVHPDCPDSISDVSDAPTPKNRPSELEQLLIMQNALAQDTAAWLPAPTGLPLMTDQQRQLHTRHYLSSLQTVQNVLHNMEAATRRSPRPPATAERVTTLLQQDFPLYYAEYCPSPGGTSPPLSPCSSQILDRTDMQLSADTSVEMDTSPELSVMVNYEMERPERVKRPTTIPSFRSRTRCPLPARKMADVGDVCWCSRRHGWTVEECSGDGEM